MYNTGNMTSDEIIAQLSLNERKIREAQHQAQALAKQNAQLRAALNRLQLNVTGGIPVGQIAVVVGGLSRDIS